MGETLRRTVVVSAVNLRKGGTLTILRQCLEYLSLQADCRVVALVHSRSLCDYPGIEYIEIPWSVKSWFLRLWCEYVTMNRISREMAARDGKVWMWLSLHDTTPRVVAEHQEVYCHTSFPFMKIRLRDWFMDPKIPLFAMMTRWAYRINIRRNDSIIVQQNWFADAMSSMLGVPREKFRVIPPSRQGLPLVQAAPLPGICTFLYVSTPDCHKNFETLCEAARLLESDGGLRRPFRIILTVKGDENRYARWLYRRYSDLETVDFHGLMPKTELAESYASADCLVFPSRIETWGLPISEFIDVKTRLDMKAEVIVPDLPYAHETSEGAEVEFFPPEDAHVLKELMKNHINR